MRRESRRWITVAFVVGLGFLLVLAAGLASVPRAGAVFAGANGKIAFASDRDGNGNLDIYTMNADGSDEVNLTHDAMEELEPKWSPDGRKIAFIEFVAAGNTMTDREGMYVMNADGSNMRQLTNCAVDFDWSPDGRKIVFQSCAPLFQIYVVNLDGSDPTRLTSGGYEWEPAWSPDGRKIAYSEIAHPGYGGIYTMNADGSAQTNLTKNGGDVSPEWSSDGRKIAFEGDRGGGSAEGLYLMNANGSELRQLASGFLSTAAVWSPDGRRIAFQSWVPTCCAIDEVNLDGSDLTTLTNDGLSIRPRWSPDGHKIAFERKRDYSWQIYTMNADGSDQTQLTSDPVDGDVSWQTVPSADLALGLTATATTAKRGHRLTYTMTVHSSGPSNAINVTVSDRLPARATFVSAHANGGSCRRSTETVTCSRGFQLAGTSWNAQIVFQTNGRRRTIRNTIRATSSTADPNPANNTATTTTTLH